MLTKKTACPYLRKGDGCIMKDKALAKGCPFFKKETGCPFYFNQKGCPLKKVTMTSFWMNMFKPFSIIELFDQMRANYFFFSANSLMY